MPAKAAAAAAPPPPRRRALTSVTLLVTADAPLPCGAPAASAIDGAIAVNATAATVARAAARPTDENAPFRINIDVSSMSMTAGGLQQLTSGNRLGSPRRIQVEHLMAKS